MGARKQIAKLLAKIPKISSRRADQAAALCWRVSDRGSLEILFVTSRIPDAGLFQKATFAGVKAPIEQRSERLLKRPAFQGRSEKRLAATMSM